MPFDDPRLLGLGVVADDQIVLRGFGWVLQADQFAAEGDTQAGVLGGIHVDKLVLVGRAGAGGADPHPEKVGGFPRFADSGEGVDEREEGSIDAREVLGRWGLFFFRLTWSFQKLLVIDS